MGWMLVRLVTHAVTRHLDNRSNTEDVNDVLVLQDLLVCTSTCGISTWMSIDWLNFYYYFRLSMLVLQRYASNTIKCQHQARPTTAIADQAICSQIPQPRPSP